MRKRTITCISKNIFWYLIYLLPWICVFISFIYTLKIDNINQILVDSGYTTTDYFLDNAYMIMDSFSSGSFIGEQFYTLFGPTGVFPIFGTSYGYLGDCIFAYFSYFVGVYILHLCVDFLLFIPRLAHKWMNSFTSTEDCD